MVKQTVLLYSPSMLIVGVIKPFITTIPMYVQFIGVKSESLLAIILSCLLHVQCVTLWRQIHTMEPL